MDAVALAVVVVFVAMMAAGAMALPFQRPPVLRRQIGCPEDYAQVAVALSWNPHLRWMSVTGCDHRRWKDGYCGRSCEGSVQNVAPAPPPTTVIP